MKKVIKKVVAKKSVVKKTKAATKKIKTPKKIAAPAVRPFPVPPSMRTEDYWALLNNILDPELGVGIVDLGLIYDVKIEGAVATVTMTFTSMACPVGPNIIARTRYEMESYPGIEDVNISVVWTPVWTKELIKPEVREMLFNQ
ncbi:MAG: metal-sulfur cluster assembly factor [Candidatus Magasanikbacteria bacterium]|nr:metal-sulfur cluster assembly factor [Candidatus Magasanikbacteria bacterium]